MPNAEVSVRERPILFSGPMVRATLDGTKTQTRRVVTPTPALAPVDHFRHISVVTATGAWEFQACAKGGGPVDAFPAGRDSVRSEVVCRYGAPGDRLWVRETWSAQYDYPEEYQGNRMAWHHKTPAAWRLGSNAMRTYYRADRSLYDVCDYGEQEIDLVRQLSHGEAPKWAPAIHMPRWASRLSLLVTDVRVERLQEISEEDCVAEGVRLPVTENRTPLLRITGEYPPSDYLPKDQRVAGALFDSRAWMRAHYASLWNSINAKRAPWESNPWVWVVSFRRVEEASNA